MKIGIRMTPSISSELGCESGLSAVVCPTGPRLYPLMRVERWAQRVGRRLRPPSIIGEPQHPRRGCRCLNARARKRRACSDVVRG